ncbi:MAG TPA: hypothetical protein VFR49_15880, partial [Solirubrobacteraceae bacterium]|nr:hypothetical protein [Solirubrobacteraceae bacterium]
GSADTGDAQPGVVCDPAAALAAGPDGGSGDATAGSGDAELSDPIVLGSDSDPTADTALDPNLTVGATLPGGTTSSGSGGGTGATGGTAASDAPLVTTTPAADTQSLQITSHDDPATSPSTEPWSARGPPAGAVLISAATGGTVTAGGATLTFAPGALPADAYVTIDEVAGVFDLNAFDAATGERISTFGAVQPVLSIFAGRWLTTAPQIVYLADSGAVETISSSYDRSTGIVSASLAHFSEYTSTFTSGVWDITLDDTGPHTVTVSVDGTDLKLVVDSDPAETKALASVTKLVIHGSDDADTIVLDPSAAGFTGTIRIEGLGDGTDKVELQLPDAGGSYTLASGDPTGPRFAITVGGAREIVSAGLDELLITGGTGADSLTFDKTSADFGEKFTFDGGDGSDTIVGPDKVTLWRVTGHNEGNFRTGLLDDFNFTNVESITGGSKIDGFDFPSGGYTDGTISGGTGAVELDLGGFVFLRGNLTISR